MASTNTESTKWSQFGRLQPRALFERALMPSGSAHASSGTSSQTIPTLDGAMEGLLAQVFPEFQLLGPIGRGGSGTVYRAEHRQLKRTVALKVLTGGRALSVEAIARFEREIQAAGKLDDPRIVRAFDGGASRRHLVSGDGVCPGRGFFRDLEAPWTFVHSGCL